MMDNAAKKKAAEEAAAKKAAEESAALNNSTESTMSSRVALLKLKFDEEADAMEMEKLKLAQAFKKKKRDLLQAAIEEGLDNDLADCIASIDIEGTAAAPPTPAAAAAAAAAPPQPADISQLVGSQRLKNTTPAAAEKFSGGTEAYSRFIVKFDSQVMDLQGVSDAERFVALQDWTAGEAHKMISTYVYNPDK